MTKIVDGGTEARFVLINVMRRVQSHGEVRLVDITGEVKAASDGTTELVTNLEDKGNFSDEFIVNSIYSDLSARSRRRSGKFFVCYGCSKCVGWRSC